MSRTAESPEFVREEPMIRRGHGLHTEGLRCSTTPVGVQYPLIHFDVPFLDPGTCRLSVGGQEREPLTLEETRGRPRVVEAVMMGCVGTGRSRTSER